MLKTLEKAVLQVRLDEVREKLSEKKMQLGRLAITPRSSPGYSHSKFEGLRIEIAQLEDTEAAAVEAFKAAELEEVLAACEKFEKTRSEKKPKKS